jgi:predicted RNA-binding protein Jag
MLKSFLHQSSDVGKAISEAWEQSEKPIIFTVKIIDAGKKGFLGFSYRPATISFMYGPTQTGIRQIDQLRHITETDLKKEHPKSNSAASNKSFSTEVRKLPNPRESREQNKPAAKTPLETETLRNAEPGNKSVQKKVTPVHATTKEAHPKPQEVLAATQNSPAIGNEIWSPIVSDQAVEWLEGFFRIFGQSVQVKVLESKDELLTLLVQSSNLQESLVGQLFKDNLFACACATLTVQSLRNKNGQRFKGLKIKITI